MADRPRPSVTWVTTPRSRSLTTVTYSWRLRNDVSSTPSNRGGASRRLARPRSTARRWDPRRLIPTQAHAASHGLNARLPQPLDDLRLEQRREQRTLVRLEHLQLVNAMLRAAHPRHLGVNPGLVLHRAQMTPAAMPAVVARTRHAALGTPGLPTMLDVDLHRPAHHRTAPPRMRLVHPKHHLPHPPRRVDPQQPLERPGTLHPASLRPMGDRPRRSCPHDILKTPVSSAVPSRRWRAERR